MEHYRLACYPLYLPYQLVDGQYSRFVPSPYDYIDFPLNENWDEVAWDWL